MDEQLKRVLERRRKAVETPRVSSKPPSPIITPRSSSTSRKCSGPKSPIKASCGPSRTKAGIAAVPPIVAFATCLQGQTPVEDPDRLSVFDAESSLSGIGDSLDVANPHQGELHATGEQFAIVEESRIGHESTTTQEPAMSAVVSSQDDQQADQLCTDQQQVEDKPAALIAPATIADDIKHEVGGLASQEQWHPGITQDSLGDSVVCDWMDNRIGKVRMSLATISSEGSFSEAEDEATPLSQRSYFSSESTHTFPEQEQHQTASDAHVLLKIVDPFINDLSSKTETHRAVAAVDALKAGAPTRTTRALAYAERTRCWLLSFSTIAVTFESIVDAAAKRTPEMAAQLFEAASQCVLDELHASRVAVQAFAQPEVLNTALPEALDIVEAALQRGRPNFTATVVAKAEHVRQRLLGTWHMFENVGSTVFNSSLARNVSTQMQHYAAIVDAYEQKDSVRLEERTSGETSCRLEEQNLGEN